MRGMHVSAQFDFMFAPSSSVSRAAPEHYYIISSVIWMLFVCPLLSVNLSYSWRCCSIYEIKTFLKKQVCGLHSFKNCRGTLTKGKWSSLPLIMLHGVNEGETAQLRRAAHSWEEWTQTPPTWRSMNMLGYCPFLLLSSIMWSAAVVKRNYLSVRIFSRKPEFSAIFQLVFISSCHILVSYTLRPTIVLVPLLFSKHPQPVKA